MSKVNDAGGRAASGDLLGGDRQLAGGPSAAAVLLVDGQAVKSHLGQPSHVVPGKLAASVVASGPGRKLLVRELGHR